jgi:hypothetical protein
MVRRQLTSVAVLSVVAELGHQLKRDRLPDVIPVVFPAFALATASDDFLSLGRDIP